ncbi:hypothetical protein [Corynebacterium sp. H78]|uniref:hypothetical protein n=1 Tax=Corynebacterium sp. H78 TaxID=3133417 RepID=UPI0030A5414A
MNRLIVTRQGITVGGIYVAWEYVTDVQREHIKYPRLFPEYRAKLVLVDEATAPLAVQHNGSRRGRTIAKAANESRTLMMHYPLLAARPNILVSFLMWAHRNRCCVPA